VSVRGAARLAASLDEHRDQALLFRTLATLRTDVPVFGAVDELRWRGPAADFEETARRLGATGLWDRTNRIGATRSLSDRSA
jgi:hypothetical protein